MAIIDSKGYVRGAVGPSVFRRSRGKSIVQSRPRKFRQTAATIESSSEFGMISSTGGVIRYAFKPVARYCDGAIGGRVVSAVSRSVRAAVGTLRGKRDLHDADLSPLVGLEFNTNSRLHDVLRLPVEVGRDAAGQVKVRLPAMDTRRDLVLSKSQRRVVDDMQIRFLLIGFNFRENYYEYIDHRDLDCKLEKTYESQSLNFDAEVPAGCMLMLSMSISFYGSNELDGERVLLNSREFSPCALIGAWQSDAAITLTEAQPAAEEKEGRVSMNYYGNKVLAALPARVRRKARVERGRTSQGSGTSPGRAQPPVAIQEEPEFFKGQRVKISPPPGT